MSLRLVLSSRVDGKLKDLRRAIKDGHESGSTFAAVGAFSYR